MGHAGMYKLCFFILYIGENLVQIVGMDAVCVVLLLHSVRVIFCVYDEHRFSEREHNVAFHDGQHVVEAVVKRPADMRSAYIQFGMLSLEVLQNELFVQSAHALIV